LIQDVEKLKTANMLGQNRGAQTAEKLPKNPLALLCLQNIPTL
jgi:hypothetical protein